MAENKDITLLARKQRYLALLKKVNTGNGLTKNELKEFGEYDKQFGRKKAKNYKVKAKDIRLPVSVNRLKYLGYTCHDILEAESLCPLRLSLVEIMEKFPQLKAAWERGRFLRDIKNEAESGGELAELAKLLEYKSEKEFINMLKCDYEAKSIWNSIRKDRV